MNYVIIKGNFRVVKHSPDGDSLKFQAKKASNWKKIVTVYHELFAKKIEEGQGVVQLRLQGIDALETHYTPSKILAPKTIGSKTSKKATLPDRNNYKQPEKYGNLATEKLLEILGLQNVVWSRYSIKSVDIKKGKTLKTYSNKNTDPIEGYIIVNDVERKGRPISFAFAGKTRLRDGGKITKEKLQKILKDSINYQLLAEGLVYPYFFHTLSAKLRNVLADAVKDAQKKKLNIWLDDQTERGIKLNKFSQITGEHIILPYLFRRLIKHQYLRLMQEYWKALEGNKAHQPKAESLFLKSFFDDTNPYVFVIDTKDFKRLDEIVVISRNKIRMSTHPGNIVFLS
ncbi:MAG: hypothetical protein AB8F94_01875 [Saprospiraceae bacterium]